MVRPDCAERGDGGPAGRGGPELDRRGVLVGGTAVALIGGAALAVRPAAPPGHVRDAPTFRHIVFDK